MADKPNFVNNMVDEAKGFAENSMRFVNRCTKPDKKGTKLIKF